MITSEAQGSSVIIDRKEASAALSEINEMVERVRQSRIYEIASQVMIAAGGLVMLGNLGTIAAPHYSGYIWIGVNVLNVAAAAAISMAGQRHIGVGAFDLRMLAAFLMFYGFGVLCTCVLGHFGPREIGTFWPIYFMLFYSIAGLWFGRAFIAIGLAITALTLIGYFFMTGFIFLVWMAIANGGGLIVGGLWMRRGE